jgi:hypothetical protein
MQAAREIKSEKFQMLLEKSTVDAVDEWGFANRVRTRAEAIRRLVWLGIEKSKADSDTSAIVPTE